MQLVALSEEEWEEKERETREVVRKGRKEGIKRAHILFSAIRKSLLELPYSNTGCKRKLLITEQPQQKLEYFLLWFPGLNSVFSYLILQTNIPAG